MTNYDAERLDLVGGSSNDTFNIISQNQYSTIHALAGGGTNRLTLSPEVMSANLPVVIFNGGPGTDTLELDGSTLAQAQSFTMLGTAIQRFLPYDPFAAETQFDAAVDIINIKGGSGGDSFELLTVAAGQTVNATGNGGADTFRVGKKQIPPFDYTFSGNILGTVNIAAGLGSDLLYVDDLAYTGPFGSYSISSTSLFNTGGLTTGRITFDSTLDQLDFHVSNAGSRTVTVFGLPAATTLNLFGGTGVGDTLIVDDHALAVAPFRLDLGADYYKEYYGTAANPTIRQFGQYSGFENFRVTAHSNTQAINIFGVAAGVTTQVTPGANTGAVTVYPHDADGNLTINGDTTVFRGGGAAQLVIDDTGQAKPIDYVFSNTLIVIDRINGLGAGTLGPGFDMLSVTIKAGDGNDTFDLNQHKVATTVALYGGGGNDVLNFGGGNLPANIANLPTFFFDGQDGFDTFNLNNGGETNQWAYTALAGSIQADRIAGAAFYTMTLGQTSVEQLNVNAGSGTDVLGLSGVAVGETLAFHGGDGGDAVNLPADLTVIQGPVYFYGDGGTNNINELSNSATDPITVHIDGTSLGAFPGDTYFGPGGALYFDSVQSIVLTLGSDSDTVYAEPDPTTTLTIRGGGPAAGAGSASFAGSGQGGSGDFLGLAFAIAENPVFTPNGTGAGTYTFDNAAPLNYTGFESTAVDDIAPYIVAQSYDESVVPTINVEFSEDVSIALSLGYFELINTTTAEPGAAWLFEPRLRRRYEHRQLHVPRLSRRRSSARRLHRHDPRHAARLVRQPDRCPNAALVHGRNAAAGPSRRLQPRQRRRRGRLHGVARCVGWSRDAV